MPLPALAAPAIVSFLVGALASAAGSIAGRALVGLGFTFIAFKGIDTMLDFYKSYIFNIINSQSQTLIQVLGIMQIGTAINMIFSAYLARLIIGGLLNGSLTKLVNSGGL